jgi:hypothetical protein
MRAHRVSTSFAPVLALKRGGSLRLYASVRNGATAEPAGVATAG